MKHWDTVAIIGVGLIGGSIGLALRSRGLARQVVGIGRRQSSLKKARECGAVTSTTTNLSSGVADAQLVVVCTPVGNIVDHVQQSAATCPSDALITDAGSTKADIVAALDGRLPHDIGFVGSHPLAGSEQSGPLSAKDDLFDNRVVVVTPARHSDSRHVDLIEQFWKSLGGQVTRMSPRAHDEALAAISHLPHLLASMLAAATPKKHLPLAATGWQDTTRIAAGDVDLWRDILGQNRDHVLKSLGKFEKWLAKFRTALERDDPAQIAKLLEAGKQNRDAVGS